MHPLNTLLSYKWSVMCDRTKMVFSVHSPSLLITKMMRILSVLLMHVCWWGERTINLLSRPLSSSDPTPPPSSPSTPSSHAVTLPACTCQISLTSSAATPHDTPPYCPEPAFHLTLHVFVHLSVWKAKWGGKEAVRGHSHAECLCVKCECNCLLVPCVCFILQQDLTWYH